jgi:hypothetical protein
MAAIKSAVAGARDGLDSARAKISSEFAIIREAAPSLTTGLLIAALLVGAGVGAGVSNVLTRWSVNRDWRERIAEAGQRTTDAIDKGNADAADVDAKAIDDVKGAFANAAKAEKDLQDLQRKLSSSKGELELLKTKQQRASEAAERDRCSVPADCLRRQ